MARSKLTISDKKWQKLKKAIPEVANSSVDVGIQSDAGSSDEDQEGVPLATRAAYNEFGTRGGASGGGWGGPVPARPFMGSTVDEKREAWGRVADRAISRALTGEMPFKDGLAIFGTLAQQDIQTKILTLDSPPNSDATIALKKSSNPMIDTGAMRQAIRYVVNE